MSPKRTSSLTMASILAAATILAGAGIAHADEAMSQLEINLTSVEGPIISGDVTNHTSADVERCALGVGDGTVFAAVEDHISDGGTFQNFPSDLDAQLRADITSGRMVTAGGSFPLAADETIEWELPAPSGSEDFAVAAYAHCEGTDNGAEMVYFDVDYGQAAPGVDEGPDSGSLGSLDLFGSLGS